ncbi:unnamed protein product [Mesocestoides corti]|uniref:Mediator of RNA polymerase II transcription subunit 30 n=1 Tax=Mesocestoides corti TaxID=53468 RepID=A0A0R3U3A4_MESCO|nr:unnamed protein product [Mesocestoides corti]
MTIQPSPVPWNFTGTKNLACISVYEKPKAVLDYPLPIFPFQHPPLHDNLVPLPSGLLIPFTLPSQSNEDKYHCVNDIQNRRRKMKKHKRRKWRKKYASLVSKFKMQRQKKEERKLQELLELWRSRTEAWDPAEKAQPKRESEPELSNPISDTEEGQKALLEATSIIRDLTLALNRVYENIRDVQGTQRLNADLSKNFKEHVEHFQHCRSTIKKAFTSVAEACSRYNIKDSEDIIPYVDAVGDTEHQNLMDGDKFVELRKQRDVLQEQIAEADDELDRCKEALVSALWELNDLTYPVGK